MHTMKIGNYTVNFNGDFSGDILVHQKDGKGFIGEQKVAEIPFLVMLAVVGEKIRREKISKLEDADPMDIVYGKSDESW